MLLIIYAVQGPIYKSTNTYLHCTCQINTNEYNVYLIVTHTLGTLWVGGFRFIKSNNLVDLQDLCQYMNNLYMGINI